MRAAVVTRVMKRVTGLLVLTLLSAAAGCTIIDHGGELPPAAADADAQFYDPWDGTAHPLLDQNMRRYP